MKKLQIQLIESWNQLIGVSNKLYYEYRNRPLLVINAYFCAREGWDGEVEMWLLGGWMVI